MVITDLVPHTITSFTTFLQSCNCAAFASDLKCRCDLVQNESIWHIGGTEANKHAARPCRYLLTNYNQLTVGTHKYVKDSIDGRNAKQILRFGLAVKNMQFRRESGSVCFLGCNLISFSLFSICTPHCGTDTTLYSFPCRIKSHLPVSKFRGWTCLSMKKKLIAA